MNWVVFASGELQRNVRKKLWKWIKLQHELKLCREDWVLWPLVTKQTCTFFKFEFEETGTFRPPFSWMICDFYGTRNFSSSTLFFFSLKVEYGWLVNASTSQRTQTYRRSGRFFARHDVVGDTHEGERRRVARKQGFEDGPGWQTANGGTLYDKQLFHFIWLNLKNSRK